MGMNTQTTQPTDCSGDRRDICDDISSRYCYNSTVRHDCCKTCYDYLSEPIVPGCEFGDRVKNCDVKDGRRCYDDKIRKDCCHSCQNYETSIQDCRYGDKIGNCTQTLCPYYNPNRLADCCSTCQYETTSYYVGGTSSTWSTGTTTSKYTGSLSTTSGVSNVTSRSAQLPDWTIPAIASVGGALILVIVILLVVMLRRRRQQLDHQSPITDKMYNDYKLSKRAPIAPPRHPSTVKDWTNEKEDGEYAYINPDHVEGPGTTLENNNRRSGNDPLPQTPGEYLDLCDAKSTSYGYTPSADLARANNHERVQSNKYDKFPLSTTSDGQILSDDTTDKL